MKKYNINDKVKLYNCNVVWEIIFITPKPDVDNKNEYIYVLSDIDYKDKNMGDYTFAEESEIKTKAEESEIKTKA